MITVAVLPMTTMAKELTGSHCWQQTPFEDVLCFDIVKVKDDYYTLLGENVIPEEATYPVGGSALKNEQNFQLQFVQNFGEGRVFKNAITLDEKTLEGTWSDNSGHQGDFKYLETTADEVERRSLTRRNQPALLKRDASPLVLRKR